MYPAGGVTAGGCSGQMACARSEGSGCGLGLHAALHPVWWICGMSRRRERSVVSSESESSESSESGDIDDIPDGPFHSSLRLGPMAGQKWEEMSDENRTREPSRRSDLLITRQQLLLLNERHHRLKEKVELLEYYLLFAFCLGWLHSREFDQSTLDLCSHSPITAH